MFVGAVRFLAEGWVDRFYGQTQFHFKYWGFGWVDTPPVAAIYALYAALAVLSLLIAFGVCYRAAIILFFVGFTYTELLDVTNYLNHYYLVSLVAGLMCFMPLGRGVTSVPAWCLYLLRFQIATVYIFAGLAKFNTDWLLGAQPLEIWLSARSDLPILGNLFELTWVAYVASWFGFVFDTTIVGWLSWRRTRPFAYAAVLVFHGMTHLLFNIGLFPFIMTAAATLFFDPSWPRRLVKALPRPAAITTPFAWTPARRAGVAIAVAFCVFQVLMPLRHVLYPGDVAWNEEGMRWSWKVMLREKHGAVTYYVTFPEGSEHAGKTLEVSPHRYLDARQEREMAGQPDLILQLAHHIAGDFAARGHGEVEVRAEALVSLNGRPARPMIDPTVDLARLSDGLARKHWILPAPPDPPIRLHATR